VRLVGDHDDVVALRADRHGLVGHHAQLVDQREHVPVVLTQEPTQMSRGVGLDMTLDDPGVLELAVELVIELGRSVTSTKRPVAVLATQDLLGEEQHREALPRALRVPEDPEPALTRALVAERAHRSIDAEELVVLRQHLDQPTGSLERAGGGLVLGGGVDVDRR
jgi:hypothetical protein